MRKSRALVWAAAWLAIALIAACGRERQPAAPAPKAVAPAPVAVVDERGKAVYAKACALCHAAGVAGAPKPGDKAEWGPRLAQGEAVLYKHSIEGFTRAKGVMPARGGNAALTDDEVKAAVNFMVAQSR
jgi:cytochrome c5